MESNADFLNDVIDGLDYLLSTVMEFEDSLMDSVAQLAKERKPHLITKQLIIAEKIKDFSVKVEQLKTEWLNINGGEQLIDYKTIEDEKKGVHERTEWWIADESVKIETKRLEGSPYSNVFPLAVFKEIATAASDFVFKKKFVKTSDVLHLLQNEIISHSDYKKTPRIPVYATFKVLVKEKLLKVDDTNSHKYIANCSKEQFIKWIENLSN
ncbi:MAG: hypothetical protein E7E23_14925 [Paenibacillus sp.]|uniref:hypothetical protein n=1 Tax=Paenibacillus sp. TaxID=58172 RepID=UPI0028FF8658|nr:hypothetical protein [Paenibacillus sp.]MDU2241860.1 hypothetical protein [Paenibacillus sp.]